MPNCKLHTILFFHRVREAMASGRIGFYFIPGEINPAENLSKHWGYTQIGPQLKSLMFWKFNMEEKIEDNISNKRGVFIFTVILPLSSNNR
jgi:hypothetical protein